MPQITTESQVVDVTIPALTSEQNVPIVVASGKITYTGAALSAATIFTPSTVGTYRVSVYVSPEPNVNYPAGAPTCEIGLAWTDSNAARSISGINSLDGGTALTIPAPQFTAMDQIIQSTASAIQVSTSAGSSLVTYDLSYVVEQLA